MDKGLKREVGAYAALRAAARADGDALVAEAAHAIAAAEARGLTIRLLGGIAIRAVCPSSRAAPFARPSGDIDFIAAARGNEIPLVEASLRDAGWDPDEGFNLYNGDSRLLFRKAGLKADLFLGAFTMCHEIPLDGRLGADPLALPLAELMLTKLQIVKADEKDISDAACLLLDHETDSTDWPRINMTAFAAPCAADWGLWRTVKSSLARLYAWAEKAPLDGSARSLILARVEALDRIIEVVPKTLAWKARALIGEKLRWYELPEEVDL